VTNEAEESFLYEPISFITERTNVNPDSPRHFKNKRRRNNLNTKMNRRPRSFNFIDGREEKTKKTTLRVLKAYHSCDNDTSRDELNLSKTQFTFEEDKVFVTKEEAGVKNLFTSPKHKTLTASASNSSGFYDLTGTESDNDTSSSDNSSIAPMSDMIACSREESSARTRLSTSMNSLDDIIYADRGLGNSVVTPDDDNSVFTPEQNSVFTPELTKSLYEKRNRLQSTLEKFKTQPRSRSIDMCNAKIELPNKKKNRKISIEQCVEKLTLNSRRSSNPHDKHDKLDKRDSRDSNKVSQPPKLEKKRRITVTLPLPSKHASVFSNIRIESVV